MGPGAVTSMKLGELGKSSKIAGCKGVDTDVSHPDNHETTYCILW